MLRVDLPDGNTPVTPPHAQGRLLGEMATMH